LPEIHTKMGELCKKHGLGAGGVGFVMNSQMISWQTMTSLDDSDPDSVERFHKWQSEFREWYGGKGGVFQYRLPPSVPDYVWTNQLGAFNLLKSIKAILDPNNILSPGTFELGEK
jgi:hypothetical protein